MIPGGEPRTAIVLLGPQRLRPTLADTIHSLGIGRESTIATVTAGWQERESDDEELHEHLARRSLNLALYRRAETVFQEDPELEAAHHRRQQILRRLQGFYALRLTHGMAACEALLRLPGEDRALEQARAEAIETVRALDLGHLERVRDVHAEFDAHFQPLRRTSLAREREEILAIVRESAAVAVAGGHVAVLLNRLRLFGLATALSERPLIAWSAGAMAISDRVVLFHDRPPHGPGWSEVLEQGLGLAPGIMPFPHAKRRLDLDDLIRVALAAMRFAPARCVTLDQGTSVRFDGRDWIAASNAGQLGAHGGVEAWAA